MSGGASYGYTLLWVIAVANLVAMFVQALSATLGIATGQSLAALCRRVTTVTAIAVTAAVIGLSGVLLCLALTA
jgi:manganese transport protein